MSVTDEFESRSFERVENMKDLGVIFDSKLDCQAHIHEKVNKAYSVLGVIKRNFMQSNRETFVNLYKAMVRPHIEYANCVWSPFKLTDIKAVEKVQMRATKLVIGVKSLPYCERLQKLKLLTLKYRSLRGDMIEVYKILTCQNDANVSLKLILNQRKAIRGHDYKLLNKSFYYDLRKYSFSCRVLMYGIVCQSMLLKHLILTYLRLVWINFGLIKILNIYGKLIHPRPEVDQE